MATARVNCYWMKDFDVDYDKDIEVFVDVFPDKPKQEGVLRFCVTHEPKSDTHNMAIYKEDMFDYILTYNDSILQALPAKAHFFMAVNNYSFDYKPRVREFGVSTVVGWKNFFPGHLLRHELWYRQNEITIPKKFFLSGAKSWVPKGYEESLFLNEVSKDALWDTQFHICIENVTMNNFFTEKIVDCFNTLTIPVYVGCPNIGDFFEIGGIMHCKDVNEIIERCNSIKEDNYETMRMHAYGNFITAKVYFDYQPKLREKINQILKTI